MEKNNIILIGMMGSGKTTVGQEIAKISGREFFDLDEMIEHKHGKINEIFAQFGENYFRAIESLELSNFLNYAGEIVLSTGGGIILSENNIENLKKIGKIYYLSADCDTIFNRIEGDSSRPLLNVEDPKEEIQKILASREEKYKEVGIEISTSNRTPEEIGKEIYEKHIG